MYQLFFKIICISIVFQISKAVNLIEANLHKHLFTDYNKNVRPVINRKDAINVTFAFEINQLREVNDRQQYVRINAWVRQYWNDDFLKWNESKWDNIKEVKVPRDSVWIPDIVLHNNAGDEYAGGTDLYQTEIKVSSNGVVTWFSPATFSSSCKFTMRHFPFDKQKCELVFSSWTEDANSINLINPNKPLLTENYVNSSQWVVGNARSVLIKKYYPCCVTPFSELTFSITLHRKSLYYTFNVITPCIILVVNIFVGFYLPPDCGERVSLTITILLAVAVFLQLVGKTLPQNSDGIPILAIFYILIMAETALSLLSTCIVLVIYHRSNDSNPTPIPGWINTVLINGVAKVLQVTRDNAKENSIHYDHDFAETAINYETLNDHFNHAESSSSFDVVKRYDRDPKFNLKAELLREVQKIRALMLKRETTKEEEELQDEWRYLAKVVDRLFFWIFIFGVILTGCCVLLPSYFESLEDGH